MDTKTQETNGTPATEPSSSPLTCSQVAEEIKYGLGYLETDKTTAAKVNFINALTMLVEIAKNKSESQSDLKEMWRKIQDLPIHMPLPPSKADPMVKLRDLHSLFAENKN